MMVVYSNIYRELTVQVKGAAKMMVTVVATQELEAGDVLRRFEAKAVQDEPRRGNNNNRCIVVGLVAVGVWTLSFISVPTPKSQHSAHDDRTKRMHS